MAIVPEPLTALIALNRFGLGARPGDFVRAARVVARIRAAPGKDDAMARLLLDQV